MKTRPSPCPLNSLALAFAAVGLASQPTAPARPFKAPPRPSAPAPSYPVPPWRKYAPTIKPPPPLIGAGQWSVETWAEARDIYLDIIDKKTGKPTTIKTQIVTHHAAITSATATFQLAATPGRWLKPANGVPRWKPGGSSIKRLSPADIERRAALAERIATITAAPGSMTTPKRGKPKPCLSADQKAEVADFRQQAAACGSRHLPSDLLPDLAKRLGANEAARVIDFLLPPAPPPAPPAPRAQTPPVITDTTGPSKVREDPVWSGQRRYSDTARADGHASGVPWGA